MKDQSKDYGLFFRFIEAYTHQGFKGIDSKDPLVIQLEEFTENNNQFFYIADLLQMKVLFSSSRSTTMIGIKPENLTPYHFMECTHPDDIQRLNLGRTKIIKMGQDLFITEKGSTILSTNFRMRGPEGKYSDFLIQCYIFFTSIPYKTVFFLKIQISTGIKRSSMVTTIIWGTIFPGSDILMMNFLVREMFSPNVNSR
jgi:hypothetical protein